MLIEEDEIRWFERRATAEFWKRFQAFMTVKWEWDETLPVSSQ